MSAILRSTHFRSMSFILLVMFAIGCLFMEDGSTSKCTWLADTPGLNHDIRLVNHTFRVVQHVLDFRSCVLSCLHQGMCASMNFHEKTEMCELNFEDELVKTDLVPMSGWRHAASEPFSSLRVGACIKQHCGGFLECEPVSTTYRCNKVNLCYLHTSLYFGEYRGTENVTVSGRRCQRWDTNTPQNTGCLPTGVKSNDTKAREKHENYCRMGCRHPVPWCYTTDPGLRWDNCSVQRCEV